MSETLEQVEERMTKAGFRKVLTVKNSTDENGEKLIVATTPAYDEANK